MQAVFQGWRVVAGAFVLAIFAWGIGFYGPGIYIATLAESRGWPVGLLSAAVTWHYLVSAGLVAQLPELHRRFGITAVTRAGALAFAIGLLTWGFGHLPALTFAAASLTGMGWALCSGAAINAMISPWFERQRPKALAMAYNGASFGGILVVPLWAWLIAHWGFGVATAVMGALVLAVVWPVAGRLLGRAPAAYGQYADGLAAPPSTSAPPPLRSRRVLLRDPLFRGLSMAFAIGLFAQMGLVAHLVSLLLPALGVRGAGLSMALVTICALLGRSVTGWLLPEGPRRRWAAAATFAVQLMGSLVLLLVLGSGSVPLLLLGCALFGLGVGNLLSLPPLIAQAEFPAPEVGRVVALMQAINQGFYALAPAAFGLMRDLSSPEAALAATLALQALAAGLVLRRPRP